jgi:hypothetical protein
MCRRALISASITGKADALPTWQAASVQTSIEQQQQLTTISVVLSFNPDIYQQLLSSCVFSQQYTLFQLTMVITI